MMAYLLILCFLSAFLITFLIMPSWIKLAKKSNLIGRDINKFKEFYIAESGGICILAGFTFAILLYIGAQTFIFHSVDKLVEILAILCAVLIIGFVGFVDDILGWKTGLKQWQKPILTIPAAIPLMVINAGESVMNIPFVGNVDFGLLYPLLLVPAAIIVTSNGFNMLAGLNGLEAGFGAVILGFMSFVALQTGYVWAALIAAVMVVCLLAFLWYNWVPARIFPGDTLTYSVGSLIGITAIAGNMEKIGVILFTPFFIEFLLKARYKFKKECFGVPQKDGTLELPENQIHSLTHVALRVLKKFKLNTERNAVLLILSGELTLCLLSWMFIL